jgi:HrpA-like RNA helicase
VLPTYLIDFSADDGDNRTGNSHAVALQQQQQREEKQVKKNIDERKKQIKTIKAEEEKCIATHKQQYRSDKAYYKEKIEAIAKEMSSYKSNSTSMSEEDETRFRFLWRSFEREKSQYVSEPLLPFFADKRQVLQKILDNDVLIVSAATGAGKSSQLPQYLLDDVFD